MDKLYFKEFKKIRQEYRLEEINNCGLCNKPFELNSSIFVTKDRKAICKECYKKVSKQASQTV